MENMILTFYFASTLPQVLALNHTFDVTDKCINIQSHCIVAIVEGTLTLTDSTAAVLF